MVRYLFYTIGDLTYQSLLVHWRVVYTYMTTVRRFHCISDRFKWIEYDSLVRDN